MTELTLDVLKAERCVAILRAQTTEHFVSTARTLAQGGIHVLEFPLTTEGALNELPRVIDELGPDAFVGVGTVTTVDQARASIAAGAHYLVTPTVDVAVIECARQADVPILVGALSPTEILTAWTAGATAVKLFPASIGTPQYLKDLRGPFPDIPIVPTGGVRMDDLRPFLDAGAIAFGMGGALVGSAPDGGSQDDLRERIRVFRQAVGA